ncbi:winged helix-turn-helix domain-containing protein [Epilithonimonas sp. UC225_85]|uniref:winged helix-turn-helix domain-containing protein n=1 Tax=Epilithonimonas sp. UC225_85 TaxID=3350167 RepID=UPI0036D43409
MEDNRENLKKILNESGDYSVVGSLWIEYNEEKFFGPGRIELLQHIDETGSISKAAKEMKMSYKKAWNMINELNSQTRIPFVILKTGGKEGGGAVLSEAARDMIVYAQELRMRFQEFLKIETNKFKKDFFQTF